MSSLNRKVREFTHEGAPAKSIDFLSQLERSVMSCLLWEGEFYEDGIKIADRIKELCDKLSAKEIVGVAIQAKLDMRLRHVPLFLAREVIRKKEGRGYAKELFDVLITRPDDMQEFLAIYWKDNGNEPLAKQVKIHLGEQFRKFSEYQLQKYNGGNKAIKLRDIIRLVRPKPANDEQNELWGKLVKNELATPDTWEVAISSTMDKRGEWTRLLAEEKLGGLALLRNIRNMREAEVDVNLISESINDIKTGKLLPINFISAAKHNPQFEIQLEKKFFECFGKEKATGKTIILVDVSGSMKDKLSKGELTRIDVACSLAMIGRELFDDCRVFTFSDNNVEIPACRGFALRDAIISSQPHECTYLGQSLKTITASCQFDRLIVITDEQSHDRVPDIKGYMINVASNKNGVGYGKWFHIDGWSDKVLDYILKYEKSEI